VTFRPHVDVGKKPRMYEVYLDEKKAVGDTGDWEGLVPFAAQHAHTPSASLSPSPPPEQQPTPRPRRFLFHRHPSRPPSLHLVEEEQEDHHHPPTEPPTQERDPKIHISYIVVMPSPSTHQQHEHKPSTSSPTTENEGHSLPLVELGVAEVFIARHDEEEEGDGGGGGRGRKGSVDS